MGTIKIKIALSVAGPLADGTAHDAVREYLDHAKRDVADRAVELLRNVKMDRTGRATGHYQDMLKSQILAYNDILISDPVIYGPWLEGTSKRNSSTRFKGYRLWRQTKNQIQREAPQIAQNLLPEYIARIGGTP
jgi:hypothetical protein